MANVTTAELIAAIHTPGCPLVLVVTGGGSRAIAALLSVGGASRTVLEATVPYSAAALTAWLGARPEQFCADRTARAMAMVAYQRALKWAADGGQGAPLPVAGLSCTASLASDRPKRGEHRAHVALQTAERTVSYTAILERGARSRGAEEELVAGLVLNGAAEAAGLVERLALPLTNRDSLFRAEQVAPPEWRELFMTGAGIVHTRGSSEPNAMDRHRSGAIFSGAFNPLHEGHRKMAAVASSILEIEVEYEISIVNVDKPPLDYQEIDSRLAQFSPDAHVWLSAARTFVEKTRVFPGATFVVGIDTLRRIGDVKYYEGSVAERDAAIREMAERGCRFLVFGRAADGGFWTLDELDLPAELARLCQQVPEEQFREDVSSTELRRRGGA